MRILLLLPTLFLLVGFACKRLPETEQDAQTEMPRSPSKLSSITEKPPVSDQKPVAPGRARAVLEVVRILPEVEPAGNGPCSQAPCKAEVRIMQVLGYGSGFNKSLGQGQQMLAYFPMTVQPGKGRPGVTAGKKIKAELKNSLNEKAPLVIHSYALSE